MSRRASAMKAGRTQGSLGQDAFETSDQAPFPQPQQQMQQPQQMQQAPSSDPFDLLGMFDPMQGQNQQQQQFGVFPPQQQQFNPQQQFNQQQQFAPPQHFGNFLPPQQFQQQQQPFGQFPQQQQNPFGMQQMPQQQMQQRQMPQQQQQQQQQQVQQQQSSDPFGNAFSNLSVGSSDPFDTGFETNAFDPFSAPAPVAQVQQPQNMQKRDSLGPMRQAMAEKRASVIKSQNQTPSPNQLGNRFSVVAANAGYNPTVDGNPFDSSDEEEEDDDNGPEEVPYQMPVPKQKASERRDSRLETKKPINKQSTMKKKQSVLEENEDSEEEEGQPSKKQVEGKPKKKEAGLGDWVNEEKKESAASNQMPTNDSVFKMPVSPDMMNGACMMNIDVLDYMKKGTPFLKYGKTGFPHFRQFLLSDDNTKIVWFSKGKKIKDTQIDWSDVSSFNLGQTTLNFTKHPATDLAKASFSVIYDGDKTLDLIAKDPNEYYIWVQGITRLMEIFRNKGREACQKVKDLVIYMPVKAGRRSVLDLEDFLSKKPAEEILEKLYTTPAQNQYNQGNSKNLYTEVAKNATALKEKLKKREGELMSEKVFHNCVQYDKMQIIVAKIRKSLERIQEWFQSGSYQKADDEIWRAGVDMESLKNMMHVAKGSLSFNFF